MKRTALPTRFQELLAAVPYVTLATTCPEGTPWNTPVFGYFDDALNFYWASWTKNQHSRNIAHNHHVFVVVFDSKAPEGDGVGLYFRTDDYRTGRG
jgi:general stress protein 26